MPTPTLQTLVTDAQQVLNLTSISAIRSVVAVSLANANTGTPLNPNLTTQQLWDQFYQVVTQPKSDIESIIANQLMKFLYAPPAPGGAGANGQVIFNDGGVLAGAANLYWNKVQQRLGLGTSTPNYTLDVVGSGYLTGNFTITGDLTVRTNKLKVDSTGVGIGTTSPGTGGGVCCIQHASNNGLVIDATAGNPTLYLRNIVDTTPAKIMFTDSTGLLIANVSTTLATFSSSGNLGLGVTPSASGGVLQLKSGITFPATQVASSDANTLDDYEEGTWTPSVGGTATYTTQTGRYTKIGNRVYVNMRLEVLLIGTGSTFLISGLPFASSISSNLSSASVGYFGSLAISANYISGYVTSGASTVRITGTTAASANITNGIGVIGDATDIALSFFYEV